MWPVLLISGALVVAGENVTPGAVAEQTNPPKGTPSERIHPFDGELAFPYWVLAPAPPPPPPKRTQSPFELEHGLNVREVEVAECRARANPRWLAVTVIYGEFGEFDGVELPAAAEWIIDRCAISMISSPDDSLDRPFDSGALITFQLGGTQAKIVVLESPKEICAALADCAVAGPP